jgi:hypothetical protein
MLFVDLIQVPNGTVYRVTIVGSGKNGQCQIRASESSALQFSKHILHEYVTGLSMSMTRFVTCRAIPASGTRLLCSNDGRVLISGSVVGVDFMSAGAELYDPSTRFRQLDQPHPWRNLQFAVLVSKP